ncbi:response regulator transcription factor [Rheinheimera fenheensis]|uniref:response regulator transcription factor n=1 Tax=Rheinheimera fenheensis TaxID=3152295 RepID=UPI003261281C
MRLLVVEDTKDVAELLFDYFEMKGCEMDYASNGKQGLNLALSNTYDAIILDIMMPGLNGYEVCNMLREQGVSTPIIMLTARDTHSDIIKGLDRGADDYVIKPFDTDVLYARVRAAVRRATTAGSENKLTYSGLIFNSKNRELSGPTSSICVSPIQAQLLKLLMQKAPDPVSRSDLQYAAWPEEQPDADLLRRYIYQLRAQFEKVSSDVILQTIPKFGYQLCLSSVTREG